MTKTNYIIKTASLQELKIMIDWAAQEGWNPGLFDASSFYDTDPNGFLIGYLNDEPIACISAVSYGNAFSFIGFYIVKSEFRGQGYGIQIWNKAIEHLKQNENIGLDGVVAQQENYKKSGFIWAYANIRYEYTVSNPSKELKQHITPIQKDQLDAINAYDFEIFGHKRSRFLVTWLQPQQGLALCALENQEIRGYGVIRKCRAGYKIGPLFCQDENIADALFQSLLSYTQAGEKVYLDVPEINPLAMKLAHKYKMEKSFETARMYTKEGTNYPIDKVFGVTTFELG